MENTKRKWQLSLGMLFLVVALFAIAFAVFRPREQPVQWQTLDTLTRFYLDSRIIHGDGVSKEFRVVGTFFYDLRNVGKSERPSCGIRHRRKDYFFDDSLESSHYYDVFLVVEKGETSPQWIVVQRD